ncbi:class I SAM-dependent methyltransferase [Candidatus Pacearchaeota archaeon]|nr:class I SAM-dependent methyltransferase [Candidatus Pacearchaeota archaeon]
MEKWTGKIERPIRVWTNPKLTDDIYLHFSEVLKDIKKYSPEIRGKVLDLGAGKSPYKKFFKNTSEYLRLDNRDYKGIDIVADITKKLPIKDKSFDSVVCIQVLEHVKDPEFVVNEICRILKNNGRCLLTTHMAAPLHGEPYDYYRFTKYALEDLFKDFKYVEIKESGGAALSIFQLIIWGVSEKLPLFIAKPVIFTLNCFGKISDKIFYSDVFTINYTVLAIK